MKAITIYVPHVLLVARGIKLIETRGWKTDYRGPIAIHVGQHRGHMHLLSDFRFKEALGDVEESSIPFGSVIAIGNLVGCVQVENLTSTLFRKTYGDIFTAQEREFGDYRRGRYGLVLTDMRQLPHPVRVRGQQQLWNWVPPAEVWSWLR